LALFDLFGHEGEGGEQLHQYLHDYLSHSFRRRDLGVNFEALQEAFYGLEQFDDSVQVGADGRGLLRNEC